MSNTELPGYVQSLQAGQREAVDMVERLHRTLWTLPHYDGCSGACELCQARAVIKAEYAASSKRTVEAVEAAEPGSAKAQLMRGVYEATYGEEAKRKAQG